jgi:hypothetical protein
MHATKKYKPTRRNIPEDDTLHSHRLENLKSYTMDHMVEDAEGWGGGAFVTIPESIRSVVSTESRQVVEAPSGGRGYFPGVRREELQA